MCGLTGYNGLKPADIDKIKIIAIYNESRGKHSCGIFSGGKLGYGHEGNKLELISNYLQEFDIPAVKGWNNIMVHTRAATVGAKTLEGCHPFEYKKANKRFFFMHNGTITNWKDLVKDAGLNPENYISDSKGMGAIVFKEGNCKVFQKYKGAGSFIFCDNQDKNTLWVYRGAAGGKEERPLFCWFDLKNQGIYISSMIVPLKIISGGDMENIKMFAGNTLCKITNGKIVEAIKLERDEKLHEDYKVAYGPFHGNNYNAYAHNDSVNQNSNFYMGVLKGAAKDFYEQSTQKGSKIVWSRGRYWRNGHLLDGTFEVSSIQYLTMPKKSELLPGEKVDVFHFIEGVLMTNGEAYEELRERMKEPQSPFLYPLCSKYLFAIPFTIEKNQTQFTAPRISELSNKVPTFFNNKKYRIPFTNAEIHINSFGEVGDITFLAASSLNNKGNGSKETEKSLDSIVLNLPEGKEIKKEEVVKSEQDLKKAPLYKAFNGNTASKEELIGFFTATYPAVKPSLIKGLVEDALYPPAEKDVLSYITFNIEWGIEVNPAVTLKSPQEDNPFFQYDVEDDDEFSEGRFEFFESRPIGQSLPLEEDEEESEDYVELIKEWYKDFDNLLSDTELMVKDLEEQAKELGITDPEVEYVFNYLKVLFKLNDNNAEDSSTKSSENGDNGHRSSSSAS